MYHGWDQKSIEKDKRAVRKLKGIRRPHASDKPAKPYDTTARIERADALTVLPLKVDFRPRGFGKKSRSGCRMSDAARAAMVARSEAREKFFASLRG